MIKLEAGSKSDKDKHNKHHKYTLDEALTSSVEIQLGSVWSINPTTVTKLTCFCYWPFATEKAW